MITLLIVLLTLFIVLTIGALGLVLITGFSWLLIPALIDILMIWVIVKLIKRKKN